MGTRDHQPSPGALARLLLDRGETAGALRILSLWRIREPGDEDIVALETEARGSAARAGPLGLDRQLAERYIQDGFLPEALELLRLLQAEGGLGDEDVTRLELLEEACSFTLPAGADPAQTSAEAHLLSRRLSSALLDYRELARKHPMDREVLRRADQLRAIVLGVPQALRGAEGPEHLAQTRQIPLLTQAPLMLREGNLDEAARLYTLLCQKPDPDPLHLELAPALIRLTALTTDAALELLGEEEQTAPGTQTLAAYHVRMGNYSEAATLYRELVENHPDDEAFFERFEDLQTLQDFLFQLEMDSKPAASERGAPKETPRSEEPPLEPARQPDPEGVLGKRWANPELGAYRAPGSASDRSRESNQELRLPTRRMDDRRAQQRGKPEAATAARTGSSAKTIVDLPTFDESDKEEARPPIDPRAMVEALKAKPEAGAPLRSAASSIPTRRIPDARDLEAVTIELPTEQGLRPRAKTLLSPPPTVADDRGSSVVEVPKGLASVVERTPGRFDADEAAEVGEPLGVLIRPVILIE